MANERERTLEELEKRHMWAVDVEVRQRLGVKTDFLGFIDVLAGRYHETEMLGVQLTDTTHFAAHVRKITEDCRVNAARWLLSGNRIEVWGWFPEDKPSKKHGACRVREITLSMLKVNPCLEKYA